MDVYQIESLTHLMSHVMRLHFNTMHALMRGQELHPGQPPLLFQLSRRDGQSQKELAEKLRIKPATVTVMLNRMEKNGLVKRRPDERDQRISRVFLTEKGRKAHEQVREVLKTIEVQCFARFTPEEKVLLRRFLLHMYENMKAIAPNGHGEQAAISLADKEIEV